MLEKALALEPNDPWAHNDLGVTQRLLGSELQDAGKDPRIEYAAAQASFERATAIDPEYVFAFANQIDLAATLADYQLLHGTDPSAAVARAQTAAARCLAIDPSFYKARYNLGEAQLTAAKYLAAAGRDPRPMLTQVRLTYEQLIAVQPKSASVHLLRARAAIEEARSAFGSDASTTALADAHAALARAIEADDRQVRNHTIAAELALLEAREAERRSDNATPALERALAEGRRAVELDVNDGEAAVVCARAYARLARTRDASARQPLVAAGLALIDAALSRSADDAEAHLVHAALLDLADTEDVRTRAAQETQRAFAIDPLLRGRNEW